MWRQLWLEGFPFVSFDCHVLLRSFHVFTFWKYIPQTPHKLSSRKIPPKKLLKSNFQFTHHNWKLPTPNNTKSVFLHTKNHADPHEIGVNTPKGPKQTKPHDVGVTKCRGMFCKSYVISTQYKYFDWFCPFPVIPLKAWITPSSKKCIFPLSWQLVVCFPFIPFCFPFISFCFPFMSICFPFIPFCFLSCPFVVLSFPFVSFHFLLVSLHFLLFSFYSLLCSFHFLFFFFLSFPFFFHFLFENTVLRFPFNKNSTFPLSWQLVIFCQNGILSKKMLWNAKKLHQLRSCLDSKGGKTCALYCQDSFRFHFFTQKTDAALRAVLPIKNPRSFKGSQDDETEYRYNIYSIDILIYQWYTK